MHIPTGTGVGGPEPALGAVTEAAVGRAPGLEFADGVGHGRVEGPLGRFDLADHVQQIVVGHGAHTQAGGLLGHDDELAEVLRPGVRR